MLKRASTVELLLPDRKEGRRRIVSEAAHFDGLVSGCPFRSRCSLVFERCRAEAPVRVSLVDHTNVECHVVASSPLDTSDLEREPPSGISIEAIGRLL